MPISLSKAERKLLEKTTTDARNVAESACRAALENLAVHEKDFRAHMVDKPEQRRLRNRLRARGRALGDRRDERSGTQGIYHLTELCAYEHWHRLLFTRFLTENHLLITDEANGSVPITLEECEELAPELGARDGFDLACRFASLILPGVFRRDDPVLDLPIALNDQVELRRLLASLPSECFRADDALGWTYQFWQAQRKDEVNKSGKKIGADELAPVTQLFTEDYMVEFLLHNTLGAWWAGKLGPIQAASEEEARALASLPARDGIPAIVWSYLRFVQDETTKTWLPAAGTFDGWPKAGKMIRLLDPCMGSGHFLVFALPLLVRLRIEEEQLAPKAAVVAVLKDNIHGLELDERCTQIAAFNVALTAWKLAGYQALPQLQLACSGLAPSATEAEWLALAGNDDRLQRGMMRLYGLFKDAPVLGSLINPPKQARSLIEAEFLELAPLLSAALDVDVSQKLKLGDDVVEMKVIAQGLAKAAELLAENFTLVITNVPFLGRGNQDEALMDYCEHTYSQAKGDLATCFLMRSLEFSTMNAGSTALVIPQNWLTQKSYQKFRQTLLQEISWNLVARLGPKAFQTPMWDFNVQLLLLNNAPSRADKLFHGLDASSPNNVEEKANALRETEMIAVSQIEQMNNTDARISFSGPSICPPLGKWCTALFGSSAGDRFRFVRNFWEVLIETRDVWEFHQTTPSKTAPFVGREEVILWEQEKGQMYQLAESVKHLNHKAQQWRSGKPNWGKRGVVVSLMAGLPSSLYTGEIYAAKCTAIIPFDEDESMLTALWAFASSETLLTSVREINQRLAIEVKEVLQVPFDLTYWKDVAAEEYPHGLPKPFSSDPKQWLFNGNPRGSDQPLHVAVARLLGYEWPRQTGNSFHDCPALGPDGLEGFADGDGIVCLPPVNHEQPAANRLRTLLAAALGAFDERSLIAATGLKGSKSKTLEDWLRDEFFEQHAKLFHDRPFIWHLWDGRSDGFHALINYHKLDHANLQKLTYSYLGDWIQQQDIDAKADKPGAADRLGAAQKLQKKLAAILEGEVPLDIFVRWKPIKEQAQGWHPDLNDGIRQNIRPFLLAGDVGKRGAGLFRTVPLKLKADDRGSEPHRPKSDYPWFWCEDEPGTDPVGGKDFVGTRWNNVHLTLEKKRKSRA